VLEAPDAELHAPALCDVEVTSALGGLLRAGRLSDRRAGEALDDYLDLPLERHSHTPLIRRMLELRGNFSAHDATYVALAEMLGASLLTSDLPFARAVGAHTTVPPLWPSTEG
jgi:predicted nucleic acid-binding protein